MIRVHTQWWREFDEYLPDAPGSLKRVSLQQAGPSFRWLFHNLRSPYNYNKEISVDC